jgi:hypothetical protein
LVLALRRTSAPTWLLGPLTHGKKTPKDSE